MTPTIVLAIFILGALLTGCKAQKEEPAAQSRPPAIREVAPGTIEVPAANTAFAALKTEHVQVRPLRQMLKAQAGKILANENRLAHLSSRVPGRIVAVYANLGDTVKRGDRLLLLDSQELGMAQVEYRKAKTRIFVADQAVQRAKSLLEGGVIGAAEYQKREGEYQAVQAEVQEAEERLHLLGMEEKDIQLLGSAALPHAKAAQVPLRAPFQGEIIERNATVGEVVDPTKTLFTVADLSTIWVRADFSEQQVSQLKIELQIEMKVSAYPNETFKGRISYLAATVDPATRTVRARADIANADGRLRPEMFAEVTVLLDQRPVLAVPGSALQQDGAKTIVFVAKGERRYERREVTVGETQEGYAPLISGLTEGEQVVTDGSYLLKSELLKEQIQGQE
jgi:cobalt-zinc-cadmium efflux system membrane fusion protein